MFESGKGINLKEEAVLLNEQYKCWRFKVVSGLWHSYLQIYSSWLMLLATQCQSRGTDYFSICGLGYEFFRWAVQSA